MDFYKVISIDIGIKNVGISYLEYSLNLKYFTNIISFKENWENWKLTLKDKLNKLINIFNIDKNFNIIIEKQIYGKQLIGIMYYVLGFFESKNINVILVNPISKGQHLNKRKLRKEYSITLINNLIIKNNLNIEKINYKYHDLCDSLIIGYNEIIKVLEFEPIIKNIIFKF